MNCPDCPYYRSEGKRRLGPIEVGFHYVTRTGESVRVIYTDADSPFPVVGLLWQCGSEHPLAFDRNGHCANWMHDLMYKDATCGE